MTNSTLIETEVSLPKDELRPANGERCDSCGSRAYWAVQFEASELDFCNHHYNRFSQSFADNKVERIDWKDGYLV